MSANYSEIKISPLGYVIEERSGSCAASGSGSYIALSVGFVADERKPEMFLVPLHPTKQMIEAAWATALDENPVGVWRDMIQAWLKSKSGNSVSGNR